VGIERFDGTLHGRKGGFVLQHGRTGSTFPLTSNWSRCYG
jgi:hypothetical protein